MSLTKFTENMNIISQLDDTPTQSGSELKAKFDEAGGLIKNYLNNTLTTETELLVATEKSALQQAITNLSNEINQISSQLSENMKLKIVTGQEVATNEYIDDKRVYVKRFDCGSLPNNSVKTIAHNLTGVTTVKVEGFYKPSNSDISIFPLEFTDMGTPSNSSSFYVGSSNIVITTWGNKTNSNGYVDIYYTKNNE